MGYPQVILDVRTHLDRYTRVPASTPGHRPAAVLVPLFLRDDALHLLLTRRTEEVEHHKGQMSFPGGMTDPEDGDAVATALREAEEEVGLPRRAVEVLGILSDISLPSGFTVTPVVGFLPTLPALSPHAPEVSEIVTVPLAFFLDEANVRTSERERNGVLSTVHSYPYGVYDIWGATAAIIRMFIAALGESGAR
jgi:8-oxo-dGTP pyrophosphatase MutT (NUDIX family)